MRVRAGSLSALIAAAASVAVVVVMLVFGAPVAGGSDSYGYVSQAHLWATGRLREPLRLAGELGEAVPAQALVPLGYHLAADGRSMVPAYSPGLPLVMAAFERVGGAHAVFWVVPLLGGIAVGSTWLLGARAGGPFAGAIAAVLLATSPAFLLQATAAPMSDLPATAWWTLALALLLVEREWAAYGAAAAAALAVLTRPNLVPVAIVPALFLLWRVRAERRSEEGSPSDAIAGATGGRGARREQRPLLIYAGGVAAGSLAIAALNTALYGSPVSSGYDVGGLFGWEHALPNLARYPSLLTAMQTPVVWIAVLAPWLVARRAGPDRPEAIAKVSLAAGFALAVFACYLFYPGFDAHATLRFLVPALPALFVLVAVTLVLVGELLPRPWGAAVLVLVVAAIGARGVGYARRGSAFDTWGERRYALAGEQLAARLPANAIVLAMQHSGSVRYYSGRDIVRWDQMSPNGLDHLVKRCRRLGYHLYVLLDPWEVPEFQRWFEGQSPLAALDWPPIIELEYVDVRVWDASDRARHRQHRTQDTAVVAWPFPR